MDVDPDLTRPAAQQQIVDYLRGTLGELPAGTTFSRRSLVSPANAFGPGTTVACDDQDWIDDRPVNFAVEYWVHGIPSGESGAYLDSIVSIWQERGWRTTQSIETPPTIIAVTPNDYKMIISGGAIVSVAGQSPCFPAPPASDQGDSPMTIEHP